MNNDNKTYELSKEVTHTTNNEESLALLKIQNKKINELYCTLDEKEADLKKIQLNCKSLEKKYQQSQSAFMQTEKKLKETLNQLNIQSLSQKKLYQDFSDIQNVCQENTNKLSQYEKNIMELSKEVENINSINKMLKDKNNVLSKERIGLTERIETLTESERNLKAKVKELLSAISEKDSQIGQLKNLNAKYVIEKKNSDNECASLIKKHNKLSAQLLDKETERDRLVSEYKKLNQKYNDNILSTNFWGSIDNSQYPKYTLGVFLISSNKKSSKVKLIFDTLASLNYNIKYLCIPAKYDKYNIKQIVNDCVAYF